MSNNTIITLLKVVMVFGLILIVTGIYLHLYEPRIEAMGVKGILISAGCVAIGMILSLPTKMFITFMLMKREANMANQKTKISK